MNSKRPVNLDISTIHLPIAAIISILHRVSGVILFFVVGLALWALRLSLASPAGFDQVTSFMRQGWVKFGIWLMLSLLMYHLIAGIRHLLMDVGVGESLEGGRLSAKIVVVLALLFSLYSAYCLEVWVW